MNRDRTIGRVNKKKQKSRHHVSALIMFVNVIVKICDPEIFIFHNYKGRKFLWLSLMIVKSQLKSDFQPLIAVSQKLF